MILQKTIKKEAALSGIGLHTGNITNIKFKPAPVNSGINFIRVDHSEKIIIKVCVDNLSGPNSSGSLRRSSITKDSVEIFTIEHLLSAIAALEIDNIFIEIDNNEIPGMDGSSKDFFDILEKCGIVDQSEGKQYFTLKEPVWVEEGNSFIVAFPSDSLHICYTLSYNHPLLTSQYLEYRLNTDSFRKDIASARTFCLESEAEGLLKSGFGKGANYKNTLVLGKNGVIDNELRFNDECVRHKVMDLIGDLRIFELPLKANIFALKSGHALNIKFLMKLKAQKDRFDSAAIKANYNIKENIDRNNPLNASQIMKILPHRYPFLLVDKIIHLEKGKRAIGIKNVTMNENFFTGHFPGNPIMPGVLLVEAMAQVGGVLMLAPEENRGKLAFFLAANNIKFRKTVLPGDTLVMEVNVGKIRSRTGQVFTKATVDGKVVAEADLMFALVDQ
ncbi:MAG: UDP-3-O-acyl-N-acetylglucosamine deacetylase [Candidatus Omnitrophota bacterium]